MTIRFAFDTLRGFIAVDDTRRLAAYGYPTSECATRAEKNPRGVACAMIDGLIAQRDIIVPRILEEQYGHLAAKLDALVPTCGAGAAA